MTKTIYSEEHKYTVEQLKKARHDSNMDQLAVAKSLNKTQSYISKIESGQRRIDIVELKKFSRLYKKPIKYFLKP